MEVHASAHYQWEGAAPYNVDGPSLQGKRRSAVNSYCVNILGNWGTCSNCHVGLGAEPTPVADAAQLANIDCLVCHQEQYKRVKVNGVFVPDTASMTISMDRAVQTVHAPTRATCLQCHARGGGGDNYKRGDLAVAHGATADRAFDVHMARTGGNFTCQRCHVVAQHRIAGRGSDLRQTDLDVRMTCANGSCHVTTLNEGHGSATLNRHVARVACQTCHVGTVSARNASDTTASEATEVHRTWAEGHVLSTGAVHPRTTLANNIRPVYRFWNGFSDNYSLGEVALLDPATGRYPTSRPVGAITDTSTATKLYPFKYKTADQPITVPGDVLIPIDTRVFFAGGGLVAATEAGLVNMGGSTTDGWTLATTDTLQLLTHEIAPKSAALSCKQCHGSTATQMTLRALGYTLKAPSSTVCTQCHQRKGDKLSWQSVHDKHVKDKGYDCSFCHAFTRPERQLRTRR